MNNILQPIPATLNDYLRLNETVLSNTTPAAPGGSSNVTWQKDQYGNISAYAATGGGGGSAVGPVNTVQVSNGAAALAAGGGGGFLLADGGGGYTSLTFNGNINNGTRNGFTASSTDPNLYLDIPTGGGFVFRIGGSAGPFLANAVGISGSGLTQNSVAYQTSGNVFTIKSSDGTTLFNINSFGQAQTVNGNNTIDNGFGNSVWANTAAFNAQTIQGNAPLTLGSNGSFSNTLQDGAIEYNGDFFVTIGAARYQISRLGATVAPLIDGTAAVGTSTLYARQDHVHPTDTTRAPLASPTFTTPVLGVATATSINKLTITQPATAATLTIANSGALTTVGAFGVTLTATAATNVTLPVSGTLAILASPSFTGTPLSTTATQNTNTTQIATTAFVIAQDGGVQSGATHIVAGTGAGTTPTITCTGVDAAHQLSVTTGTSPVAAGAVVTVTFVTARPHTAFPTITPANAAAAALTGATAVYCSASSTTTYTLTAGPTALAASTVYLFNVSAD